MSNPKANKGASPQKNVPFFWLVVGGIVLLGIALLFLIPTEDDKASKAPAFGDVTVTGEPLTEFNAESRDRSVGKAAPRLKGESPDGKPVLIGGPNKPTLVLFLAHWCPHCQKEVPVIVKWAKKTGEPKGFRIISVATATDSSRPNYPPVPWLERENWKFEVMLDDKVAQANDAYGVTSYPAFVMLDDEGKVIERDSGELDNKRLSEIAETLRDGR